LVTALAWLVPLAMAAFALERTIRARRTRRQTVGALGRIPELAGEVPPGTADRAAGWAYAVARELEVDSGRAATAARLHGLDPAVLTESGIPPEIAALVRQVTNAPRGQAQGEAAAVRVAHSFARRPLDDPSQWSGALFRTVVDHPAGDERRAAEALVHLVQGGRPSA
jgi:hypothetical protein